MSNANYTYYYNNHFVVTNDVILLFLSPPEASAASVMEEGIGVCSWGRGSPGLAKVKKLLNGKTKDLWGCFTLQTGFSPELPILGAFLNGFNYSVRL